MQNNTLLPLSGKPMDEALASGSMHPVSTIKLASRVARRCAAGLLAAACVFGVTGCSSNYVIHTSDGKTFNTQGAPEFTDGGYSFVDSDGTHRQILLSWVTQVTKP